MLSVHTLRKHSANTKTIYAFKKLNNRPSDFKMTKSCTCSDSTGDKIPPTTSVCANI